jgi:hypothetical protein
MHFKTAWGDYFTGTQTPTHSNEYGTRQTSSSISVYVLNSLFSSITSSSPGGALHSTSTKYFLVKLSSFFSCKTSSNGGAIFFQNSGSGQYVLYGVCGYDCCSTGGSSGQFSYNEVYNVASSKNYINYSSISRCVGEISSPFYMICHHYGTHCYPSVNMSMNKCYGTTGIYCCPHSVSNFVTCSISYSTFTDNIATGYNCIMLWTSGAKYEIKNCNILRNTQGSLGSQGTIFTYGILYIDNSCILENKATYIFLVQSSSNTITLYNCTVDSTSNNGYLTIRNTVTKSFILALDHMSTRICHSEYDSAGYLTPITPHTSSPKKQIHCYTGERYFLQPQLRDVVSLTSILFFNFIHPYAFSDFIY